MNPVPFEQTQRWLRDARAAVSRGWPTSVAGPSGIGRINVAHAPPGYAVLGQQNAVQVEVAPGCFVALEDIEVAYE